MSSVIPGELIFLCKGPELKNDKLNIVVTVNSPQSLLSY